MKPLGLATMRPRATGFGLIVMEHEPVLFALPHVRLPVRDDQVTATGVTSFVDLALRRVAWNFTTAVREWTAPDPQPNREPTPDEIRSRAEEAARHTSQDEWQSKVYLSVSGLRWRCCGNPFEDDHSPWCVQGPPLPSGGLW